MAKHLSWSLEQIFLAQGDLTRTLNDWFTRYEPLRKMFGLVDRIYPQVGLFDDADARTGKSWQGFTARRLYAVYHLARRTAMQMHESKLFDPFMTWRMLNCRPYGGMWTSAYDKTAGKAAGKQCRSLLCPWCYLRRFDALRALVKAPVTQQVRFPAGNHTFNPGLTSVPLYVTNFTIYGEGVAAEQEDGSVDGNPEAAQVVGQRLPINYLSTAWQVDLQRRCDFAVKHRLEQPPGEPTVTRQHPEFLVAVSLTGPVVRQADGKIGIRRAYLHNSPAPAGATKFELVGNAKTISGRIAMERLGEIGVEDALLKAQPYPWQLLDHAPKTWHQVITSFKGKSSWGLHRLGQ